VEAKKKPDETTKARVSTTEPDARVMKMGDGGFRPAHNVQLATATDGQIITGVDVGNTGSDQGQMGRMVEQHQQRYGQAPEEMLVDGGFAKKEDTSGSVRRSMERPSMLPSRSRRATTATRISRDPATAKRSRPGGAGWERTRPRPSIRNGPRRPNASTRLRGIGGCDNSWCADWRRSERWSYCTRWPTTSCVPWRSVGRRPWRSARENTEAKSVRTTGRHRRTGRSPTLRRMDRRRRFPRRANRST